MAEADTDPLENEETVMQLQFDKRLGSYQTFFDHGWAKKICGLVSGTKLVRPVDFLALDWKTVANAHTMPWLLTTSVASGIVGCLQADPPRTSKIVSALQTRLSGELGDTVTRRCRKSVQAAVDRIAHQVLSATAVAKDAAACGVRAEAIWPELCQHTEFVMSICGSQRLCYAGVYFAYENYVRHCTSLATGKDERLYHDSFNDQLNDMRVEFGKETADYVADEQVNIARHVRNALVHASGRISGELRYVSHGLREDGGVLQIMAPDTIALYNALKERAFCLAKRAIELPAFKVAGITEGDSSQGVDPQDRDQED